jgi:hypothetical protein
MGNSLTDTSDVGRSEEAEDGQAPLPGTAGDDLWTGPGSRTASKEPRDLGMTCVRRACRMRAVRSRGQEATFRSSGLALPIPSAPWTARASLSLRSFPSWR